jgi:hypothetical protein
MKRTGGSAGWRPDTKWARTLFSPRGSRYNCGWHGGGGGAGRGRDAVTVRMLCCAARRRVLLAVTRPQPPPRPSQVRHGQRSALGCLRRRRRRFRRRRRAAWGPAQWWWSTGGGPGRGWQEHLWLLVAWATGRVWRPTTVTRDSEVPVRAATACGQRRRQRLPVARGCGPAAAATTLAPSIVNAPYIMMAVIMHFDPAPRGPAARATLRLVESRRPGRDGTAVTVAAAAMARSHATSTIELHITVR